MFPFLNVPTVYVLIIELNKSQIFVVFQLVKVARTTRAQNQLPKQLDERTIWPRRRASQRLATMFIFTPGMYLQFVIEVDLEWGSK